MGGALGVERGCLCGMKNGWVGVWRLGIGG